MVEMANTLFPDIFIDDTKPVNVASVPQRSPFRYPGGKTWFVPEFRQWIFSLKYKPRLIIEPFVGGGIIGLTALFENLAEKAIFVEIDNEISAFWTSISRGDGEYIAKRILDFDLTIEHLQDELSKEPSDTKERAFQTILKNRTFHGGILATGSGLIKNGEAGKGLKSRWYPETLAKRIMNIVSIADRIEFHQTDGLSVISEHISDSDICFFIDPPYTAGGKKAGSRLYNHNDLDHEKLFDLCSRVKSPFLMTYDNSDEVIALANKHNFDYKNVLMKNTHHAHIYELVISNKSLHAN